MLRQFFAFARRHKIMLADPARGIPARRERGFSGRTITTGDQCGLFRRWTTDLDPKLVAAAFGMNPEGVLIYLADHVDEGRLPEVSSPVTAISQARSNLN